MTNGDHIALVETGRDAMNRGDVDGFLAIAHPEIEFIPRRAPVQGAYHGHEGLREFFADDDQSFDLFHVTIDETHDFGECLALIGTLRIRGKGSGVEIEVPTATVLTLRDGKILRFEELGERDRAMAAAHEAGPA